MKRLELTGQKFHRLTVLSLSEKQKQSKKRKTTWLCRCDCGKETNVVGSKLKNGHTRSCGCIGRERMRQMGLAREGTGRPPEPCGADGCGNPRSGKYCGMHSARLRQNGTLDIFRRANGLGNIGKNGYVDIRIEGRRIYGHVLKAEEAMGKSLPEGSIVHHVNKNRSDNKNENLVVCPDQAYHLLLHVRQEALDECGNADFKKCKFCRNYDNPEFMVRDKRFLSFQHADCIKQYNREKWLKAKVA